MHIHKLLLQIGTQVNSLCEEMCANLLFNAHTEKKEVHVHMSTTVHNPNEKKVQFIEQRRKRLLKNA